MVNLYGGKVCQVVMLRLCKRKLLVAPKGSRLLLHRRVLGVYRRASVGAAETQSDLERASSMVGAGAFRQIQVPARRPHGEPRRDFPDGGRQTRRGASSRPRGNGKSPLSPRAGKRGSTVGSSASCSGARRGRSITRIGVPQFKLAGDTAVAGKGRQEIAPRPSPLATICSRFKAAHGRIRLRASGTRRACGTRPAQWSHEIWLR